MSARLESSTWCTAARRAWNVALFALLSALSCAASQAPERSASDAGAAATAANPATQGSVAERAAIEVRCDAVRAVVGQTVEVAVVVRIEQRLWREQLIQLFRQQTDLAARIATPWQGGVDGFESLGAAGVPAASASATAVVDGSVARLRRLEDEVRDGATFAKFELVQRLVCRRAGALRIGGAELQFAWAPRFVEDLLGERVPEGREDVVRRSEPVSLDVGDLPSAGRPANFSGLIGEFVLKVELENGTIVRVGDAVMLRFTVAGEQDLRPFVAHALEGLEGFVVRGMREESEPGRRVVVHELVAARAGTQVVPRLELSFYSPRTGRYEVVASERLEVEVTPAADGSAALPGIDAATSPKGDAVRRGEPGADAASRPEPVPGVDVPFGPVPVPRLAKPAATPDFAPEPVPSAWTAAAWIAAPWVLFAVTWWMRRMARTAPERARRRMRLEAFGVLRGQFAQREVDRQRALVAFLAKGLGCVESAVVGPRLVRRLGDVGVDARLAASVDAMLDALAAPRFGGAMAAPGDREVLALAQEVDAAMRAFERSAKRSAPRSDRKGAAMAVGVLFVLSPVLQVQDPKANPDLSTQARQLLDAGDAARAFEAYAMALREGAHEPGALCFDLAVCAQRLGRPAEAVLWYERALVVDPMHVEARANLRLVQQQSGLVERVPRALLGDAVDGVVERFGSAKPNAVFALGAAMQCIGIGLVWLRRRRAVGLLVLLVGGVVTGATALRTLGERGEKAVVMVAGTRVLAEPHERTNAVGVLQAGQTIEVLERSPRWARVRVGDGTGWVSAAACTPLSTDARVVVGVR